MTRLSAEEISVAAERAARFLEAHRAGDLLLLPNAWDVGSARILEWLGFQAVATTSSGFAATLGRLDGTVTREEAIEHGAQLAGEVSIPVSADLENGFADGPQQVAETYEMAAQSGLAGFSIEDYTGRDDDPIYEPALAEERVRAAAEAAHAGPVRAVLTARTENYLNGRFDLADTVARLQRFQEAGADVLYAPGMTDLDEIATVVKEVDRPVNVLVLPSGPSIQALQQVGVRRVSVGGSFAFAAYGALIRSGQELLAGRLGFLEPAGQGSRESKNAFSDGAPEA